MWNCLYWKVSLWKVSLFDSKWHRSKPRSLLSPKLIVVDVESEFQIGWVSTKSHAAKTVPSSYTLPLQTVPDPLTTILKGTLYQEMWNVSCLSKDSLMGHFSGEITFTTALLAWRTMDHTWRPSHTRSPAKLLRTTLNLSLTHSPVIEGVFSWVSVGVKN